MHATTTKHQGFAGNWRVKTKKKMGKWISTCNEISIHLMDEFWKHDSVSIPIYIRIHTYIRRHGTIIHVSTWENWKRKICTWALWHGIQSFFILLFVVARRRHSHSHRRPKRFQTLNSLSEMAFHSPFQQRPEYLRPIGACTCAFITNPLWNWG